MELVPVEERDDAIDETYAILLERDTDSSINISHQKMPSLEQHSEFVRNHPYQVWYLILVDGSVVGSIYITKQPRPSVAGNEFFVIIKKAYQGKGFAKAALRIAMARHPGPYAANINPKNTKGIALFTSMGFELAQFTFRRAE